MRKRFCVTRVLYYSAPCRHNDGTMH